jgi:hypothetical protein
MPRQDQGLRWHVLAAGRKYSEAGLHVVGHRQDRRVVPLVGALVGLAKVRRRVERIHGGHAAVSQDRAALAADVAEAYQEVSHSKWARFSIRWIFSATSSGVIGRLP